MGTYDLDAPEHWICSDAIARLKAERDDAWRGLAERDAEIARLKNELLAFSDLVRRAWPLVMKHESTPTCLRWIRDAGIALAASPAPTNDAKINELTPTQAPDPRTAKPGQPGWMERCRLDNPKRKCVICGASLTPEQRLTCGADCTEEEYGAK